MAIAQRKEDRQAQLQLQYAQRMPELGGHSTTVVPGGYPPYYYTTPPGVVSQLPPQPAMMYRPLGLSPGWRGNGFASPIRPPFQQSPLPVVSTYLLNSLIKLSPDVCRFVVAFPWRIIPTCKRKEIHKYHS